MASSKYPASGTVAAEPGPIDLDWSATALLIIDMQRDFMEPGGFGDQAVAVDRYHLRRVAHRVRYDRMFCRAVSPAVSARPWATTSRNWHAR